MHYLSSSIPSQLVYVSHFRVLDLVNIHNGHHASRTSQTSSWNCFVSDCRELVLLRVYTPHLYSAHSPEQLSATRGELRLLFGLEIPKIHTTRYRWSIVIGEFHLESFCVHCGFRSVGYGYTSTATTVGFVYLRMIRIRIREVFENINREFVEFDSIIFEFLLKPINQSCVFFLKCIFCS